MSRIETILQKLTQTSEEEWRIVMAKCKKLIEFRTGGKTDYGAHCAERLGMIPFDYYFQGALEKLYEGSWDWKYEKYSLPDQMCRIIGSMIFEEIRKYKVEKKKGLVPNEVPLEEVESWFGVDAEVDLNSLDFEKEYERRIKIIEKAIDGDEEMETFFLLTMESKNYDEVCQELGWEKKKLYKVAERLKAKVIDHIKKQQ